MRHVQRQKALQCAEMSKRPDVVVGDVEYLKASERWQSKCPKAAALQLQLLQGSKWHEARGLELLVGEYVLVRHI